ncbi:UNVERIFIED_CONTAM: hypothetical protein GTU68_013282 [Idotea baltica]|nr:hypothetical protein [Idotea baltica]
MPLLEPLKESKPKSCDTFVVLGDKTKDGFVIFGKNSDRPQNEIQEVIYEPAKDYSSDSKLQCTYIEIDQVAHTHAVILSKPSWMWGAEMGSNEHGVCIGNEAVWTKINADASEKLLGMDLVRLGLERSKSASEALDVITSLLEAHGQGGPCSDTDEGFCYHNSFLIADPKEAWILETAESLWAAEKVTSGYRNISNCLSIGSKMDRESADLREKAKELGFWAEGAEFSFKEVFGKDDDCSRLVAGEKLLEFPSADFTLTSMFEVLRDKESNICRGIEDGFPTQGSMVSVLVGGDASRPHCHWLTGTPDPAQSVFKPFIFTPNVKISPFIQSPKIEDDPAKHLPRFQASPRFGRAVDRSHLLYRRHALALKAGGELFRGTLKEVESTCVAETEAFLNSFSADRLQEVDDLFKDCVDSELKFYAK